MTDPYINNVVLCLPFDQDGPGRYFIDYSCFKQAVYFYGYANLSNTYLKYGDKSGYFTSITTDYLGITKDSINIANQDFTVEGWFYFPNFTASCRGIFFNGEHPAQGSNFIEAQVNSAGAIRFNCTSALGAWNIITANGAVTAGAWYHLAFTVSGSAVIIFINGVSAASGTKTAGSSVSGGYFRVGYCMEYSTNTATYLLAYVDDFRVTLGVARYTGNFTPPLAFKADYPALPVFCAKNILLSYKTPSLQWCLLAKKGINIPIIFRANNDYRNINWGGLGTLSGTVKIGANPCKRRVRLYDSKTGTFIREIWSADDGSYTFLGLRTDIKYTVTSTDYTEFYNDVIAANITVTA